MDEIDQSKGTFKVGKAVNYLTVDAWADRLTDKPDCYFKILVGEKELFKSKNSESETPVWDTATDIKIPVNTHLLKFEVWDDTIGKDKIIGSFDVEFKQNEPFIENGRYDIKDEEGNVVGDFYLGGEKVEVNCACGVTDIKNDELVGTSKPYFKVLFSKRELHNNKKFSTKMKKKKGRGWLIWGQQKFTIPKSLPHITIQVWDDDKGKDDFMGELQLPVDFPKGEHQIMLDDEPNGYFVIGDPVRFVAQAKMTEETKTQMKIYTDKEKSRQLYRTDPVKEVEPIWNETEFFVPPTQTEIYTRNSIYILETENNTLSQFL